MTKPVKIRLFVDAPLGPSQSVSLSRDQANYLFAVMRLAPGDAVLIFNGQDGEWRATVAQGNKRGGVLVCEDQTKLQRNPPDVWLLFAPIKKNRTDFIVEKATELGAARIIPVQTDFTNSERVKQERLQAHAVEAAEQCGGVYVPPVEALQKLDRVLADWPKDRHILFCDETMTKNAVDLPKEAGKWAILIGPEGGFSPEESARIRKMENTHVISLGPRVLRADTAAVAALTLWQYEIGDWRP